MKRLVPALLLASLAAGGLAGCLPTGNGGGALSTAEAFIQALDDGDAAAAIALTTTDRSDFACELEPSVAGAELGDVVENGDTAIAKFTYAVFGEFTTESLELERVGSEWKIVLPDDYRIEVPLEADVVVEATFEDDCVLRPVDGVLELRALPGYYSVTLRDPSGVFGSSTLGFAAVPDAGTVQYLEGHEQFIEPVEREIAANLLQVPINDALYACIENHFAGGSCPDGLPAGDEDQAIDRPFELISGDPRAVDISSADGETWRFSTNTQTLQIQVSGVLTSVPFTYSGIITVDDGDLVPVFD